MGFYGSVINAEKLIRGGHHIDLIRLSLSAFPVHELIDGLVRRSMLKKYAHNKEKSSAQGGRAALGDAPAANIDRSGLVRRRFFISFFKSCTVWFKTYISSNIKEFVFYIFFIFKLHCIIFVSDYFSNAHISFIFIF